MKGPERETDGLNHDHMRARRPRGVAASLSRSSSDRRIGGVAGGIALFVGASPETVRLLWALSVPLTGGLSALAYLLFWLVLPSRD